jgi:general secretion pathway protein J
MNRRLRKEQGGMTLIELLVAMSVLSLLSLLGYQAFAALLVSRTQLMATSTQWIELARVFRHLERDLERLPPADGSPGALPVALQLDTSGAGMKLVLKLMNRTDGNGDERIEYRADRQGLFWASDRAGSGHYPLLPAAYRVSWRVLLSDGRWVGSYPDVQAGLPRLLEMRVEFAAAGYVTRWWRLP